jgi:hypothetical protein
VSGFDFGHAGFKFWRKHELGKKLTRKLFPRAMARRDAKHPLDEVSEDFNSPNDEVLTMNGFKTYTGLAVAAIGMVLGWLGVGETDSAALSSQIVGALDQIVTVGGLLFAAYGRAKAKPAA